MIYLIDTNILIYHFNGNIPDKSASKINKIFKEDFNISVITKMEFLGFRKHTKESFKKAKKFLEYCNVIELDDDIVNLVIDIRRNYSVKLPDAIIAATAIFKNYTLVTRNTKDFEELEISIYNPFDD